MLGLGFPQLILILAGICFMLAGIYGLAPSLVTAMFNGRAAPPPAKQQSGQFTKQQQKAERARQHAEQAKAEAAAKAERERAEDTARAERERAEAAAKAEQEQVEATRKAEQQRVEAEKKKIEAEQKQAEEKEKAAAAAPVRIATFAPLTAPLTIAPEKPLQPEATFTPPVAPVRLADVLTPLPEVEPATEPIAPIQPVVSVEPPPSTVTAVNTVDTELVEELFAEMFALRSTVADLVGEVHQLRDEQKPRRFVIEELRS